MSDLDDLRDAEMRLQRAQLAADIAELQALVHPEATYTGPDGTTVGREADLAALSSGAVHLESMRCEEIDPQVRDGVGVTTAVLHLEGTASGQPFDARLRYIRAWGRGSEGWRVVDAHAALAEEADPPS